jgi:hypothetical protein
MLYSRRHHAAEVCSASIYDPRHDWCWAHVENEEQARALGEGWVESPADLPPRGEMPIHAPEPVAPAVVDPHAGPVDLGPKSHPDSKPDELTGIGAGSVGVAKPEDTADAAESYGD